MAVKRQRQADNSVACAVLSYFLVGIIWYLLDEHMRKNSYVSFHARQGLALILAGIIASVALGVLSLVLFWAFVFAPILWLVHTAVWVGFLVLWIMGIISAVNGEKKLLPVLGEYAQKLAI